MEIKFRNLKPIRRALDKFSKRVDRKSGLLDKIGTTVIAFIRKRTLMGVDAKGSAFKPYSLNYAEQRRKKGRPTGTVTLSFFGRMLSALTHRILNRNTVRIAFSRTEEGEKAYYQHEKGREFVGLTPEEENKINDLCEKWLNGEIKKAGF
jgi:hypothetical protein